MKIYQNGTSSYMGGSGTHVRALRGDIVGWSPAAARRQRVWAWSVDSDALSGTGYALTLTLVRTPENAADFQRLRDTYFKRLARMGMVRAHWVTEWQRRGTPHLHLAVYFAEPLSPNDRLMLVGHWLILAADSYGAGVGGQDLKDIAGPLGWLQYLAKHATRGVAHYQRQGHPDGWSKTGRLWGALGEWPTVEPVVLDGLSNPEFFRLRRIMRKWAISDAVTKGDANRARYLKHAPKRLPKSRSRYQGVGEWMPKPSMDRLVTFFENENGPRN